MNRRVVLWAFEATHAVMVKNAVGWDMRIEILLKKGARMVIKEARRNIMQYPGGAGLRTMTRYRSVRILSTLPRLLVFRAD